MKITVKSSQRSNQRLRKKNAIKNTENDPILEIVKETENLGKSLITEKLIVGEVLEQTLTENMNSLKTNKEKSIFSKII